jgi:hypothetical protein
MKADEKIFRIDATAARKGGELAGAYLEQIGKTDLATMTAEEWDTFCFKLVGGAVLAAVGQIHGSEIPF